MRKESNLLKVAGIGVAVVLAEAASVGLATEARATSVDQLDQHEPAGPIEIYSATIPQAILPEEMDIQDQRKLFDRRDGLQKIRRDHQVHGIRSGATLSSHGHRSK